MKELQKRDLGGSLISCVRKRIEKGEMYPMHRHNYIEVEVVLEGAATHVYNGEVNTVTRGSAYIVPPQNLHAFTALCDVTIYSICFDMDMVDKELGDSLLLSSAGNFCCLFEPSEADKIFSLILAMEKEQIEKRPMADVVSKSLVCVLCAEIVRRSERVKKYGNPLVAEAISYVHGHFCSPLLLNELADRFDVTPNYLGNLFLRHTGESFSDYVNELRIKQACNMLRFSEEKISDIALAVGYSSAEYFACVFRKRMGITARGYRDSLPERTL